MSCSKLVAVAPLTNFSGSREPLLPAVISPDLSRIDRVPSAILNAGALWEHIILSRDFVRTGKEADAIQYYTGAYPTMTISKDVHWSSYRIMLERGSQVPMTMHLLIAASLMDLATSQNYDKAICRAARAHAKSGILLLMSASKSGSGSDPIDVATAFYFLYRYMAVLKDGDVSEMSKWSASASNYVKENCLGDLCTSTRPTSANSTAKSQARWQALTPAKKAHLARIIVWTFYEDIFATIRGYGGSLALYWCAESQRLREIYQHSGAELESMFGEEYPDREIVDDVQNSPIITFLYDVMGLYAEVNRVARSQPIPMADKLALEDKIDKFEAVSLSRNFIVNPLLGTDSWQRSRSLIRLTAITSHPRSRVMLNADYMVPFYYALRIYSFLCFLPEDSLGVPTPPHIQSCVSSILYLAQRSLSSGIMDPMRARFQWPLFVAGIETADCIHKEWVQSKLKSERMSLAFQRIVSAQEETATRLPMSAIRQILAGKSTPAMSNLADNVR